MAVDPREQWEPLVGRLILACGDIELRLLQLHWNLCLDGGYDPHLKNKGLGAKARVMLTALNAQKMPTPLKKKIAGLLNKATKLAAARNLVAHNPLYMDVYVNDEGNFMLEPTIRSLRDSEEHMSLEHLSKVVDEARQLKADLWAAVRAVGEAAYESI